MCQIFPRNSRKNNYTISSKILYHTYRIINSAIQKISSKVCFPICIFHTIIMLDFVETQEIASLQNFFCNISAEFFCFVRSRNHEITKSRNHKNYLKKLSCFSCNFVCCVLKKFKHKNINTKISK
jgi:hypothetical protein